MNSDKAQRKEPEEQQTAYRRNHRAMHFDMRSVRSVRKRHAKLVSRLFSCIGLLHS